MSFIYYSHIIVLHYFSGTYWYSEKQQLDMCWFVVDIPPDISDTNKMDRESHPQIHSSLMLVFATDFNIW